MTETAITGNFPPNTITFSVSPTREVMRISADGIKVADGVAVDEAAAGVIAALDVYIRALVAAKDAENERLRAALEEIIQDSFSVYAIQVARAALSGDKQ